MALPRVLKPGDTLGIAAPSSPFDDELFNAGVKALETMGFNPAIPEGLFQKDGYLAGSDRRRAEQLNRLFADPAIDGIICARGGYGAMRILPLLDLDILSQNPKVFVGFSDITALLGVMATHCGLVAFHGPTVTTLGYNDPATHESFLKALTVTEPLTVAAKKGRVIQPGRASGPFVCGNLTLFSHLTGTPFQPDLKGRILLIEDRGEAPYRIDRMLTQMRLAGCFEGLAGLAPGTFTDCGSEEEINRIVADRLAGMDIPILAGFEVGHGKVNLTLPVGLPVTLDTASQTLAFQSPALR
jgi:muramoyltetrapeptide carboxypeptidase